MADFSNTGAKALTSTECAPCLPARILEGARAKILEGTFLFVDFSNAFDSIKRGMMEQILLAYGLLPKETVTAIMVLYKNAKVKVRKLLWHCYWCSTRGYISPILVHNLPKLCTSNVDRSNERKWFYIKKKQEADDTPQKLLQTQTTKMTKHFWQIYLLQLNPYCVVWSRLHINADKTEFNVLIKKETLHTKWWFSEISGQVHLPRKQCLIYWKWH